MSEIWRREEEQEISGCASALFVAFVISCLLKRPLWCLVNVSFKRTRSWWEGQRKWWMEGKKCKTQRVCVWERESERHLRYYCIVIYPGWSVLCYSSAGETETWHSHQCTFGRVCVCVWVRERDKIPILGTISCFLCPGSCFCPQDVVEEAILLLLITESMVRYSLSHTHTNHNTHTRSFSYLCGDT